MNKRGIALVTVLIIMGIIMVLISILYYSVNTNFYLTKNFRTYYQDFYTIDAAARIEDVKIVTLDVSNISRPNVLESGTDIFPYTNISYNYEIKYEFYKQNITPGTSLNMFNDYFYSVKTEKDNIGIKEFISKIGPSIQ